LAPIPNPAPDLAVNPITGTYVSRILNVAAAVKAINANGTINQIEIQPSRVSGTANVTNNSPFIVGTGTQFGTEIRVGDRIMINNESRYINAISNSTYANVNVNCMLLDVHVYTYV
jgi:hypothetical protein